MRFGSNSGWNKVNELKALLIFKKLEANDFKKGLQQKLCKEMAEKTGLKVGSISAKVSNYKSEAGINLVSNSSLATKETYKKYNNYSIYKLQREIEKLI